MAKRKESRYLASTAVVLFLGATHPAMSSIFDDAGIYPGDKIINTVTGSSNFGPIPPASAELTIGALPLDGKLRAFTYLRNGGISPSATRSIRFTGSDYSSGDASGPFHPSTPATDRSGRFGGDIPVDTSSEVAVEEAASVVQGVPIFLVFESDAMNADPNKRETAVVALEDRETADKEFVRLHETHPRSGVFTGWVNTGASDGGGQDGTISTTGQSRITAAVEGAPDGGALANMKAEISVALLNPANIVFDSQTGEPVNGVKVRVVNASTGAPAAVFGQDLHSHYPSEVTTGVAISDASGNDYDLEDGEFRFPYLTPGTYRIVLDLPPGYVGPSAISQTEADVFGRGYRIGAGSDLDAFSTTSMRMDFDIPVDRIADVASISRASNPRQVEIGDLFRFEVTIRPGEMRRFSIADDLPFGMAYIDDSMMANGRKLAVVKNSNGRGITVPEIAITGTAPVTINYAARVLPSADVSRILRSTTMLTDLDTGEVLSASHELAITEAFGLDEVTILGRITAGGCEGNAAAPDLSGIRVLLESGEYAVTDAKGRFHFAGIDERPHVVQVDETTLPRHSRLVLCNPDNRSAGSARSQFVDLRPGMMGRVDFHLEYDEEAMRRDDEMALADRSYEAMLPEPVYDQAWLNGRKTSAMPEILTPLASMLADGGIIDVAVLHRPGESVEVSVNGDPVDPIYREQTITSSAGDAALARFHALRIREGRNHVTITVFAADGTTLLEETRDVLLATRASNAELLARGSILESNGRTQPVLRYRLTNDGGIPLRPGTKVQVAIEQPFGLMPLNGRDSQRASELRPQSSIDTVVRENGELEFRLAPVLEPGTAHIRILAGDEPIESEIRIAAAERPWVLVGLAEGTVAERQVRAHMRKSGVIGNDLSGRVALFAEGVIKGEWLMTLRVDTARDGDGEFEGIDPEKDYIVYGDQSWQGDASPSRYPLYLRLRKEGAEFLVGDFDLDVETRLISEHRKMTGVKAIHETDEFRVMTFAAETTQRYVEDSISLDGTIGPYRLSRVDIVPKSETVRLVTLSGVDANDETSSRELVPGLDYVISYGNGEIILRRPVAAFDASGRRNVIRIGYETDEELVSGMTAGIRAEMQLSERARVGGTLLHESNSEGQGVEVTLAGIDLTYAWNEALTLSTELLRTIKDNGVRSIAGTSGELRGEYDDGSNQLTAYLRSQTGNARLDADTEDDLVDTLGIEFSSFIDGPTPASHDEWLEQKAKRIGDYLEGEYFEERRRDEDSIDRRAELMFRRRDGETEKGIGLRGLGTEEGGDSLHSSFLASETSWAFGDYTFGLGLDYAISSNEADIRDRMRLSLDYALTGETRLFMAWDGAQSRDNGSLSGVYSAGYRLGAPGDADFNIGFAHARASGATGSSIFAGGQEEIPLGEKLVVSFGVDAQKDLGAADVPLGLTYGDKVIDETFITSRTGLRWTEPLWSAGIDGEYRWATSGDRGNIRISADGELSDRWSIGGDGMIGQNVTPTETEREVSLRFSAAYRGAKDAIDLFGFEYHDEMVSGERDAKAYLTWHGHRQIDEKNSIAMRYAMKFQVLDNGSGNHNAFSHLAGFDFRHAINDKFDLGVNATAMSAPGADGRQLSTGFSIGYSPAKNSSLTIGYNFTGFSEEHFSKSGETAKGAYAQVKVKFDRDILKGMFR
ncbi:carboxypeptidase-like regulatory domain-containing protein [Paracoccus litorisediminis]|uniref:carboxypeptidase-like regulatory domain-containing protein n=1 Tax=Paracoccus litorisediminis TaxID=2006130 RepID=UPI00372FD598